MDDATLATLLRLAPYQFDALRADPRSWGDPCGIRLGRRAEAFGAAPPDEAPPDWPPILSSTVDMLCWTSYSGTILRQQSMQQRCGAA
jgi:hypothetical protein